jgi:membrane protease YdiL (CAAX protease family)
MTEVASAAVPAHEPDRINKAFAGVGAAIGLVAWLFLFPLPVGVASVVVLKAHARLGQFLGFLAMLSVLPGVVWVARSAWKNQWRKGFPLARVSAGVLVWTSLCILSFIPVQIAWFAVVERTLGPIHLPDPMSSVGVLGLVLGAPVAEEALFRGYGLARIRELGGGRRAMLFTALVFALVHGSWIKLPGTFAIGLFFGWLVLHTSSLWPAVLGHFVNNVTGFLLGRLDAAPTLDPRQASWALVLALGAIGTASLALLWSPRVRSRIRGLGAST